MASRQRSAVLPLLFVIAGCKFPDVAHSPEKSKLWVVQLDSLPDDMEGAQDYDCVLLESTAPCRR